MTDEVFQALKTLIFRTLDDSDPDVIHQMARVLRATADLLDASSLSPIETLQCGSKLEKMLPKSIF